MGKPRLSAPTARSPAASSPVISGTQAFEPEDRDFLLALAQHCSQALERARLYEAERRARAEAEAAGARAAFLAEASKRLSGAADPEEALEAIARLAVPGLAAGVVVDLFVEGADPAWRIAAHVDPARERVPVSYTHLTLPTILLV